MRIPRKFKLKDKTWTVKTDSITEEDGVTNQEDRTIVLRKGLRKHDRIETFLHELMHAALFEIHLSGPSNVLDDNIEEILCTGLADILSNTFELEWKDGKAEGGRGGKKSKTET